MIKNSSFTRIFLPLSKPGFWLGIFLLTFNNLINFLPSVFHDKIYLWLNLGILCLIWLWSRRFLNLTNTDLGWTKQNLGRSILWGLGLTLLIILPFLILLWLRPFLGLNIGPPRLPIDSRLDFLWRIIFRIPLGTALFEEMLFRGILYGYLIKKCSAWKTVLFTSLLFSLWHITPALETVRYNFQVGAVLLGIGLWLLFLVSSFIAGLLIGWVRYRGKNIAGCIIAHALINSFALVIIYSIWK
ncbi:CPBP family intramembrane metalloprotease [candidate division WOR-3 bacterium]|nr:CPBP family intramembrane metalloprotease [candidate division WOR-3 bacterium]